MSSFQVKSANPKPFHRYFAYGMVIESELELPELGVLLDQPTEGLVAGEEYAPPVVTLHLGQVGPPPEDAVDIGYGDWVCGERLGVHREGFANLLLDGGRSAIVEPAAGLDELALREVVLGLALPVLLHQRGFLALHASAVDIDGCAVAFSGHSGAGKSTMLGAMIARGYDLVTDDVLAIEFPKNAPHQVHPAFSQVKLVPEAAAALGHSPETMSRIADGLKVEHFGATLRQKPLPLRRFYVLAVGDEPEIVPAKGQDAIIQLVRYTYVIPRRLSPHAMPEHLRQCAAVAAQAQVCVLTRPLDFSRLDQVVELVEADSRIARRTSS
jgi:hypothetical protein